MEQEKLKTSKESYTPEILGVLIGMGALSLWYFSSLAIDKVVVPSSFQSIITICGSAFGAFFGAYCAFKLRQHEENQNKRAKRKTALDICLFIMARQHNAVALLKTIYDQYPKELARAFSMPAIKPPDYKDLKINIDDLMFLANQEHVDFLFQLSIEQERFEQVIYAVNLRNEYAIEKLQPAIAERQKNGRPLTFSELRPALGDEIYLSSIHMANTAYEQLTLHVESVYNLHNELHEIAGTIFPGERFPKIGDKK
ncbi:hypothetical protein [Pseudomonas moraviensis]